MAREKKHLLPKHRRMLAQLGENLQLARLRRQLTASQVAQRAGISRNTLYLLEHGSGSGSIATLFSVLVVLGLEDDFSEVAKDDELGRRLEDIRLLAKARPKSETQQP